MLQHSKSNVTNVTAGSCTGNVSHHHHNGLLASDYVHKGSHYQLPADLLSKVLRAYGLCDMVLQIIFWSVIITKLLYS